MSIIGWLILGGIAGWTASKIMGMGALPDLLFNIVVGVVGAITGGFL